MSQIYWPSLYSEEIVEYMPETLLGTGRYHGSFSSHAQCTRTLKVLLAPIVALGYCNDGSYCFIIWYWVTTQYSACGLVNQFSQTCNQKDGFIGQLWLSIFTSKRREYLTVVFCIFFTVCFLPSSIQSLEHFRTLLLPFFASFSTITAGITTIATLLSKTNRPSKLLRTFKIASYAFTGLFVSQNIEHYTYKFFVHNPLPTQTKNPLWHALIGSGIGNLFMGACFTRIIHNMGYEDIPKLRIAFLFMAIYMAATYADYLYDENFYDKKFYRIIVRDGRDLDKETAAKLRFEQSRMQSIETKKMEEMIRMHHANNMKSDASTQNELKDRL